MAKPRDIRSLDLSAEQSSAETRDSYANKKSSYDLRIGFDQKWYEKQYANDLALLAERGENSFEFYMRFGARLGHDPNPSFSEVLYRLRNPDVRQHVLTTPEAFGFAHWVTYGHAEVGRINYAQAEIEAMRLVLGALDRAFIESHYEIDDENYISTCDFYCMRVRADMVSPSSTFSEEGYLDANADVRRALAAERSSLISGYHHFLVAEDSDRRLCYGFEEFRRIRDRLHIERQVEDDLAVLEKDFPGLTTPVALDTIHSIDFLTRPVSVVFDEKSTDRSILVVVPNFVPELIFGGYIAFFDFLRKIKSELNMPIDLIVFNNNGGGKNIKSTMRMKNKVPKVYEMFRSIQFFRHESDVHISKNTLVISYCAETHYFASHICRHLNQMPIFFIQEREADFHANNDMRSFVDNAFLKPHIGIYNSQKLFEYFEHDTDVVTARGLGYRFAVIENAIKPMPVDRAAFFAAHGAKTRKRLILYGRPEAHAGRNHFATAVLALREAFRRGVLAPDEWELLSVGAFRSLEPIRIAEGLSLKVMTRLPMSEYEALLLDGDLGMSFITTPHPGIVHFQMARFGLVTVTNVTKRRTKEWLCAENGNLVGVEMSIDAIVEGLRTAAGRADDLEARYDNAARARSMSADACMASAISLVASTFEDHDLRRSGPVG